VDACVELRRKDWNERRRDESPVRRRPPERRVLYAPLRPSSVVGRVGPCVQALRPSSRRTSSRRPPRIDARRTNFNIFRGPGERAGERLCRCLGRVSWELWLTQLWPRDTRSDQRRRSTPYWTPHTSVCCSIMDDRSIVWRNITVCARLLLFSPLGKFADRAIYFACVDFF